MRQVAFHPCGRDTSAASVGCDVALKPWLVNAMRYVRAGVVLAIVGTTFTPAHADSTPQVTSNSESSIDITSYVTALDSDDFSIRENAERQLDTPAVTVKTIAKQLARKDLSLEQRGRLERIGFGRFEKQERAAMGVQFSRSSFMPGAGVTIERPTEGFDSARVLMAGDVLKSIDGLPVLSQSEARPIIVSFEPGQEVTVVVERGTETKTLQMKLGSFKDLRSAGASLSVSDKRRAWEYRLVREGARTAPEPVVAPFEPEQYRRVVGEERRRKRADELEARNQAQNGALPDTSSFRALNFVRGGAQRQLTDDAATSFEPETKRLITKSKDGGDLTLDMQRQIRQLELAIRENSLRLKNAELPDELRARLESYNRNNRVQLLNLRAQLRSTQGDKPEAP